MKTVFKKFKWSKHWPLIMGCVITTPQTFAQRHAPVFVAGAMRNVMWKGQLDATIHLDSLQKEGVFGVGPIAGLKGEILVWDGVVYTSNVTADLQCIVTKNPSVGAPFFVYVKTKNWRIIPVPDSVLDMAQLEVYLDQQFKNDSIPFSFRLSVTVSSAKFHIVNLPAGTEVHSPEDAHVGKQLFELKNEEVEMLGFYSTQHKGIFTHHSTNVHVHVLNFLKNKMGHLEQAQFLPGTLKLLVQ